MALAKKLVETLSGKKLDITTQQPAGMARALIMFMDRVSTASKQGNTPAAG